MLAINVFEDPIVFGPLLVGVSALALAFAPPHARAGRQRSSAGRALLTVLGLVLIIAGTAALVSALLLFVLGYGVEGSSERHDGTGLGSLALIISFALLASGVFMIRTTRRRFAA